MIKEVCPKEVAGLEDCVGIASRYGAPPAVPKRCKKALTALDVCMETHSSD